MKNYINAKGRAATLKFMRHEKVVRAENEEQKTVFRF